MKLRIKGDSLRLRITPSEMRKLTETGRVQETIHFGPAPDTHLSYVVEVGDVRELALRYQTGEVSVVVPRAQAQDWANGPEVGIYASISIGSGQLEVAVEKDWACLDRSDADNADTFPNPHEGTTC